MMPEKISAQKKEIRQQIRELKNELTPSQKQTQANIVFDQIEILPCFKKANNIFIYWSLPDELPTHSFIEKWYKEKNFLLPSIIDEKMILKHYAGNAPMRKGTLGIMEPDSIENFEGTIDLIIVPGIAFDEQKNRLGRGKGFYDRFFSTNKSLKLGVCFNFQLLESIPVSLHDIRMDKIIFPDQVIN